MNKSSDPDSSTVSAVDRRELAQEGQGKTSRWPRTSRRHQRIAAVLEKRQPDLTIVLENVHDPHNIAAVLRTCDAVGLMSIHLVYTIEALPSVFARTTSAGASKWVQSTSHDSIASCYQALHKENLRILATALRPGGADLFETNLCAPTALVFGNEMRGLTDEAIELADDTLQIPMVGMVESLNISVSCAVCLFEALRQRRQAGKYDQRSLDEPTYAGMLAEWLNK